MADPSPPGLALHVWIAASVSKLEQGQLGPQYFQFVTFSASLRDKKKEPHLPGRDAWQVELDWVVKGGEPLSGWYPLRGYLHLRQSICDVWSGWKLREQCWVRSHEVLLLSLRTGGSSLSESSSLCGLGDCLQWLSLAVVVLLRKGQTPAFRPSGSSAPFTFYSLVFSWGT